MTGHQCFGFGCAQTSSILGLFHQVCNLKLINEFTDESNYHWHYSIVKFTRQNYLITPKMGHEHWTITLIKSELYKIVSETGKSQAGAMF